MRNQISLLAASAGVFVIAGSASAFVPWNNAAGTAGFFNWNNGGSTNGYFGSPVVVNGATFVFFPSGFRAESTGGGVDTKSDTLSFDIVAHAGFRFTQIQVSEFGDYGIQGAGSVNASGQLNATDLSTATTLSDTLVTNPGFPISGPGFGNWDASAGVDFSAGSTTLLHVELTNTLVAISIGNSTVFIEKKVVGLPIAVTIIPAPASLAVFGLGLGLTSRRRRA